MRDEDCKSSDPVSSTGMTSTRRKDKMPNFTYHEIITASHHDGPWTYHIRFFKQPTLDRVKYLLHEEFETWLWNHRRLSEGLDWLDGKLHRCRNNCGTGRTRYDKTGVLTEDTWREEEVCVHTPLSVRIELGSYDYSRRNNTEQGELEISSEWYKQLDKIPTWNRRRG